MYLNLIPALNFGTNSVIKFFLFLKRILTNLSDFCINKRNDKQKELKNLYEMP